MMARRSRSKDVYANRYRGRMSFPASAATGVWESFNTGISMTGMQPHKWDILWCAFSPAHADDAPGHAANGYMEFQLCFGTQTAMLDPDDMQVVSHAIYDTDVTTDGATVHAFPIYLGIRAPLVCLASVLTVGMVGINTAAQNLKEWYYEIGYLTRPTSPNEAAEFFAQVGAL